MLVNQINLLIFFCRIIDDVELYEQGKPFSKDNLVAISYFLNHFLFRITWNGLIGLFSAVIILYHLTNLKL